MIQDYFSLDKKGNDYISELLMRFDLKSQFIF